jgi:6-pyruvoyltetrahydropterin/6-carboxytetrahydropterin synthase
MFEIEVEGEFAAAHAIIINGEREPVHGHNWHVRAVIEGEALDGDGLLVDFHMVERTLTEIIAPFHNADLNATPPFDDVNPSAEHVALHIGRALGERLPKGVHVGSVRVTEAPGCAAVWRP